MTPASIRRIASIAAALVWSSGRLCAQNDMAGMKMPGMAMGGVLGIDHSRLGSGTSWLPDASPVNSVGMSWRSWMLSLHGTGYVHYDDQQTQRGDRQLGSTDWEMLMAMRPTAGGMFHLHAMTSLEALNLGGGGYPLLLQTGGTFQHSPIHDRQHPHEYLMEAAAMYEHPLAANFAYSLYAAAVGEPAMGPVAFMHRPSAQDDPFAPLGHHWQDAAHESHGVVTLGLYSRQLKLEGSAFNPREPDENHLFVDYRGAKLDSYTGRLSWAPTANVVASSWWAYLGSHDRLAPENQMHRYGVSVLTQTRGPWGGEWASTLMWAMNVHHHSGSSHEFLHGTPGASPHHHSSSMLAETNLEVGRNAFFGRLERVEKDGDELGFEGGDLTQLYDIRSAVAGYRRQIVSLWGGDIGLGVRAAINFVPETLRSSYGTRRPFGFAVYAQVRPKRTTH